MTSAALTQQQIRALLTELGADLDVRGIRAELFDVGGAAMSLAYNTRCATQDIDAVFEPKNEVVAAAARVAARHGLPDNWLNDAVKGFLPGPDPRQRAIMSARGINVSVPSPEYLLALKVAAARVDRDADDIRELARICGATSTTFSASQRRCWAGASRFYRRRSSSRKRCFRPRRPGGRS